jgi:hypothetical protein
MQKKMFPAWLICFLTLPFCLTGCGENKNEYKVIGTVSYNGTPVDEGSIMFTATEGESHTGGGRIVDGKYEAMVPPGEKIVKIIGSKADGEETFTDELSGETKTVTKLVRLVPQKYSTPEGGLTATVVEENEQTIDFILEE